MTTEIERRIKEEQPERVKAVIREYFGGKWGRPGEYIAVIEPEYFKNGNIKKGAFRVVETLETVKKGYGCGNCTRSESIAEVLEIL